LRTLRCGKAVWDYVNGKKVLAIAAEFEAARTAVNQWLRWCGTAGIEARGPQGAGPCHRVDDEGKRWLRQNRHRVELHRLLAYSSEFMAMEGVWKTTRNGRRTMPSSSPGPAGCQANRDLPSVPASGRDDRSSRREIPMINNPCEPV
jgi:hypothetical protein